MTKLETIAKRGLDITGSTIGLVLLSPLFVLISIMLRLDSPGRIFFCQARLGRGSRPFMVYKFRTMNENAPDIRNADGSTFNAERDPRVTRVGRVLRTTSLDELPQLLNILTGRMSFVGPRPDQVDQASYYKAEEWRKHLVKPGITGMAQINGRNSINWASRKQLDLEYVANQSLRLDLHILCRTFPYVLKRRDVFIAHTSERVS
jgi:undecaprenyl phosphate N,N'-diacetylbacillosamine 1-phosphate transferase